MALRRPFMRDRRQWLLAATLAPWCAQANVAPADVAAELPGARLRGQAVMRFFGMRVYEARLWTVAPIAAGTWAEVPLALELQYAMSLAGRQIADRSLAEMRRQRDIADDVAERWLATMRRLFPDVQAGDRIAGVQQPGRGSRFHVNGRFVGEVPDPEFTRLFFGIWLSERTSEPALRDALLGVPARG